MKSVELLEKVANKELDYFNLMMSFAWAARRLEYISNIIFTIESSVMDTEENYDFLRKLSKCQEYLRQAGDYANKFIDEVSVHVSDNKKISDRYNFDNELIDVIDEKSFDYRVIVIMKTKICDFLTFQMKKMHVKLSDTDKMAVYLKKFFSEIDKFEESLYDVI